PAERAGARGHTTRRTVARGAASARGRCRGIRHSPRTARPLTPAQGYAPALTVSPGRRRRRLAGVVGGGGAGVRAGRNGGSPGGPVYGGTCRGGRWCVR